MRLSRPAFASSSRKGAAVERACTTACIQAKFGWSESVKCAYRLAFEDFNEESDISSIDHLALREFVSGPPRYHLAIKGVREQFVIVEQNSGP